MKIFQVSAKSRALKALLAALLASSVSLALSGCTATVNLEPAPLANDPACAEITVRLPDVIADQAKRVTNAQATGAWGNPSSVILRCGIEPLPISNLACVTASGVDWLVDESEAPSYRFITFGRMPATEVIVDSQVVAGVTALDAVSAAVENIPATKTCSG